MKKKDTIKTKKKPANGDSQQPIVIKLASVKHRIRKEVSYFNGWSVTQEQMEEDITVAAKRIITYLKSRGVKLDVL